MKLFLTLSLIIFGTQVKADVINVGCINQRFDCALKQDGTKHCFWSAGMGYVLQIQLKKSGTAPNYEIWEGTHDGIVAEKFPYHLAVYQRREPHQNMNYLTIDMRVGDIKVSSEGKDVTQVHYLVESSDTGFGVHCNADIEPTP